MGYPTGFGQPLQHFALLSLVIFFSIAQFRPLQAEMPGFMVPSIKPADLIQEFLKEAPFKMKKALPARLQETNNIKTRFPSKIPVVVERYKKEKELPILDKNKFLVPEDISMSQFHSIIRNRMSVKPSQAFFLMVNRKSLMSLSLTMSEIYQQECEKDGFLYMIYCSQEGFGGFDSSEQEEEEDAEVKDIDTRKQVVETSKRQLLKPSSTEQLQDAALDLGHSDISFLSWYTLCR